MTGMLVEDGIFYVLDLGEEKQVFPSEDDAIAELRARAAGIKNAEAVKILAVDIKGEKWGITQMSWAKLAVRLLGAKPAPEQKPAPKNTAKPVK